MAYKTGLEFAPGTTDDCKRVVGRMFKPADLLGAYKEAKSKFNTRDIVLVASDHGPEIHYFKRIEYAMKVLRPALGRRAVELRLWGDSAQTVMRLPADSDAFWLIVDLEGAEVPIMCVIFAVPYAEEGVPLQ